MADKQELAMRSWRQNADAWTRSVRGGDIPSRRAGTDAAVIAAVTRVLGARITESRVLDVGCGEGWLSRALAEKGCDVLGVDGSAPLIEHARDAERPTRGRVTYLVADYDQLIGDPQIAEEPFDIAVLNFALFDERVAPLLRSIVDRLRDAGAIVIQTVHPWAAAGEEGYTDGWREETLAAFAHRFTATMPWYFRTLASWSAECRGAGLMIQSIDEPTDPASGRMLSLLLTCRRATPASPLA